MLLLDTDVMIDIMRRFEPALSWLTQLDEQPVGVPGLVAMELLQGCRNREEQQRVESLLRPYALYWPTPEDSQRAFSDFTRFHLSHGIGVLDALIAATAVGLSVPLATFNEKHYQVVTALSTMQPYERVV